MTGGAHGRGNRRSPAAAAPLLAGRRDPAQSHDHLRRGAADGAGAARAVRPAVRGRPAQDRAGQPAAPAVGALVVRHRPVRPRRVQPHDLRLARLADRGPVGRRHLERARPGARPRLRLLPRDGRLRDAHHGRRDGDPVDPAGDRADHADAARPRHRDRGHRHSRSPAHRARGARRRVVDPQPALYRERGRGRHAQHQAAVAARAAEHAGAADRAIDVCLRLGDADRGGPLLPRRRRAAGSAELGQHHRPRPHVLPDRAVEHPDSGRVPRDHRARGEPAGRRAARPARPALGEAPVSAATLLEVRDLHTQFNTLDGVVRAVDGVSFDLARGETLGIVGESGCGKSVTALSILRLIPPETGRIASGSIHFEGHDLATLPEDEMKRLRGHRISMIFQEPMTSLNPVLTVGTQIAENVVRHLGVSWKAARERAFEMLDLVRIADARRRLDEYPHQLSGGMRQRVMIAMALSCDPQVLIADEPTTALDVTIQAQILDLMLELKEKTGTAIVLITHDLGVVAETAERVVVMYAGRKVEEAPVMALFERPLHPYTRGLMAAIPRLDVDAESGGRRPRLQEIPGLVPRLTQPIVGCAFASRCGLATDRCRAEAPPVVDAGGGHTVACWEARV
ncbi:MAG: ABC transporter ATP-binding protein [Proteobacteria bacterium]|nr:ABC transporter ATP-binding protein [Pseudomonadota bacterium]